jgi:hypothetical protein
MNQYPIYDSSPLQRNRIEISNNNNSHSRKHIQLKTKYISKFLDNEALEKNLDDNEFSKKRLDNIMPIYKSCK